MGSWIGGDALTELGDPGLEQVCSSQGQPLYLEACLLVLAEEDPGPQSQHLLSRPLFTQG